MGWLSTLLRVVVVTAAAAVLPAVLVCAESLFPKKVVSLSIACDNSCSKTMSRHDEPLELIMKVVTETSKRLANTSVNLVLEELAIWNIRDEMPVVTDSDRLLETMGVYRRKVMLPRRWSDAFLLITSETISGASGYPLGKYYQRGVCSVPDAVGFIRYTSQSVNSLAVTLTHELAHGLGMLHDKPGCCPELGEGNCAMGPYIKARQREQSVFSNCSNAYYQLFLSAARSGCIDDIPKHAVTAKGLSTCGNGVVEASEDCDCGQGCLQQCCECCESTTCKFKPNARCSSGACCDVDSCQFISSNHVCRPATSPCDHTDHCNGVDAQCENRFAERGLKCLVDTEQGYCYDGACLTRSHQCRTVYRDSGFSKAADVCYNQSATNPDRFANCGTLGNRRYRACAGNFSVRCGVLQCTPGETRADNYLAMVARSMARSSALPDNNCYAGDYGDWELNMGRIFVEDGTKCADEMVCYRMMCIDKETAYTKMAVRQPPPSRLCGNGVVDINETCDCGVNQCDCCDPATCQLQPADSPCLFTGGCAKSCDGNSTSCQDVPLDDFSRCITHKTHSSGQCYDGRCASRDGACKAAFGSDARAAEAGRINNKTVGTYFNSGGFKHYTLDGELVGEEYQPVNNDPSCGILVCHAKTQAKEIYLGTKTFESSNQRVFYYSRVMSKLRGKAYSRYFPALVDHGTACTVDGQPGYCATANLKMSQNGWTWIWYALCLPLSGPRYRADVRWNRY